MSTQHTPGPWEQIGSTVFAVDETGTVNRFSVSVQGGYVCRTKGRPTADSTSEDELLANARLIAAAPNLLEALCGAMDLIDSFGIKGGGISSFRAAIAKATGAA